MRRKFRPGNFQFGKLGRFIHSRSHRERTVVHADEAASWDNRDERFEIERINHQAAHSLDGTCIDMAEEYFPRLRRAGTGVHRHIAGAHLHR
ncbi:transposase [Bradyrhizobium sp. RD5-C2]|uniref:transposase n=1 Tax=Bradyrhizobium sp. RD5-C2 TaxID=244562 RepID=UPI001CC43178